MVEAITPRTINLLNDLRISHRLKARVGALLTKRLALTPALLEEAHPDSPLEALLLSADLLKQAEGLTEAAFAAIAGRLADEIAFTPNPEDFGIIMLQDEKMAGDILAPAPALPAGLPAIRENLAVEQMRPAAGYEERMLNDPEALRMIILTSPDPQAKIEAIRRMLYSDFDVIGKGNLFFAALSDEDSIVRTEALKAMNRIGLDADLTDAMQAFCSSPPNMMPVAIKRLASILTKVNDTEAVIGARILVSRLQDDVSHENKNAVLKTLAGVAEKIVGNREAVKAISEQVLRVFIREPAKLERGMTEYFSKLLPFKDPELFRYLYDEQFRIEEVRISAVIASLLFPYDTDPESRAKMIRNALRNFNQVKDSDDGRRRVLNALAVMDDDLAYEELIGHFPQYSQEVKTSILYFIGGIMRRSRMSDAMTSRIIDTVLDVLRAEDNKLIIVLLETGILGNQAIDRDHRRAVARELLRLWEVFTIPYLQYALEDTLASLGTEAVEVVFTYIQDFSDSPIIKKLSPILGESIAAIRDEKSGHNRKVFRHCILEGTKLFKQDTPARGILAIMLGRATASPLMTRTMAHEIYTMFMQCSDYVQFRAEILEGLGWLGSSSKVEMETKLEITARFERLLTIKLPEIKGKKVVEQNMNVFVMGPEADIYTEFLPVIITGLARIGTSVETGAQLQVSILKAILRMWKRTATWETILGPAASTALVKALSSFGSIKDLKIETKKLILSNLLLWKNQLYVLGAVSEMAANGSEKYKLADLYAEVLEEVLEMLRKENDVYSEKEKMTILGCLAAVINHKRINPAHPHYKLYVDSAIKYLVRGHREGIRQTADWLEAMGGNTDVPPAYRDDIKQTLRTMQTAAIEIYGI